MTGGRYFVIQDNPMNYDNLIKWILLGVVFIVPLFILRALYDVFSFDKITLLRLLALSILSCLALKILTKKVQRKTCECQLPLPSPPNKFLSILQAISHKLKSNPLILPILAYLIISILATIFSVSPWISLMGFYKRYEGLSTLFVYIILFFTIIYFARERKFQERMFQLIFLASSLMSIYGLMQYFEIDPVRWKAEFALTKAFSAFGNPNFLGAYLAMTFGLGLYLFLKVKKREKVDHFQFTRKERRERERELKKRKGQSEEKGGNLWLLGIGLGLIYACLLVTLNRAGILGLFGGLIIFAFTIGWGIIKENKKRLIILGISLILITGWQGSALWKRFSETINLLKSKTKVSLIKEVRAQEEEVKMIKFTGSASERIWIWKRCFRIIYDHPWLGVGPDAMALVYWPYEKLGEPMTHRSLVDRAHSDFIDQAVTRGILGLLAYLWIIGTTVWMGWRLIVFFKKGQHRLKTVDTNQSTYQVDYTSKLFLAAILAGLAAFLIQNQLSFGVSGISSLFWIMMGWLVVEYQNSFKQIKMAQGHRPETDSSSPASLSGKEGSRLTGAEDLHRSCLEKSQLLFIIYKSLAFFALVIIVFLAFLVIRLFIADIYYKQGQISQTQKEVNRAIEMYKKAARLNPKESFYQEGVSLATYEKVREAEGQEKISWLKKTIVETEKAIKLNPANGFFYNTMAVCHSALARLGDDKETNENKAIEYYQKAITLTLKLTEAYNNLSLLLMDQGKLEQAHNQLMLALEVGEGQYGADSSSYRLGQRLLDQGQTEKAIKLFQEVTKWRKGDTDALRNLGVAYNKAGQNNKAKEVFEKILEINPKDDYAKRALETIKREINSL